MKALLLIVISLLYFSSNTKAQEEWEKIYSSDNFYTNYQILHKSTIILMTSNKGDFRIIDLENNKLKKQGSLNHLVGFIISDGDFVYISSVDSKILNSRIIKYDSDLNYIEEYRFPVSSIELLKITKTPKGSFVMSGYDGYAHSPFLAFTNDNFKTIEGDYYPLSENFVRYFNNITSFNNSIYAGSNNGDLYVSHDEGATWKNDDKFKELDFGYSSRLTSNDNFIHITGYDGKNVLKFKNDENWTTKNLITNYDAGFFGSLIHKDIIFLSGLDFETKVGYIFMSKDYSDSWDLIFENQHDRFNSIFVHQNKLYACAWDGNIYSTDIEKYTSVSKSIDVSEKVIIENNEIEFDFKNKTGLEIISVDGKVIDKSKYNVLNDKIELDNLSPGNYILNSIYKKLQFLLVK